MRTAGRWVAGALVVAAAGMANAMEVKPGGVVYSQFAWQTSRYNSAGVRGVERGSFDLTRIYAILDVKASDQWRGRITLEGNATAGNPIFVKQGYIEAVNVWPDGNVSLGLTPATWIGFEEEIWGRRYVAKVLTDQESVLYSNDRGLAASGKLPGGWGSYRAGVYDGEGLLAPEQSGLNGRGKDGSARLSLTPEPVIPALKGLRVHGFAQVGKTAAGPGHARSRYIAGVSLERGSGMLAANWLWAKTPTAGGYVKTEGASAYGALKLPARCALFGRCDWYDPSTGISADARERIIVGVERTMTEGIRLSLNNLHVRQQETNPGRKHDNEVQLQAELKF